MGKYKHIHIIVLSSFKTEKEIERYKQMGPDNYLVKPSSYEEYVKAAQMMLDKLKL